MRDLTETMNRHRLVMANTTTWTDLTNDFLSWMRAGGARPGTLDLRRYQLNRLALDHPDTAPLDLTTDDLTAWLSRFVWKNNTLRSHRAAVVRLYGWAHATNRMDSNPAKLLPRVRASAPAPKPAPESVIDKATAAAADREKLMIQLGSRVGLRRGEIAPIQLEDVQEDLAGWSLRVHGKGGKTRTVPLPDDVAMLVRNACIEGKGWAFPSPLGGHLTPGHVGKLLRQALVEASGHQLRHRFATVTYRRTGDIVAVSEFLGHSSVATTQMYVATGADRLRAVVMAA